MDSLKKIFEEELSKKSRATDKTFGVYPHIDLYEILFSPYRELATKVFEIGVNRGGSICAWQKYFSNATIYGLDINRTALRRISDLERIIPIKLDQSDPKQLNSFSKFGPFDIGIDDGSHIWNHQVLTFERLWPSIKPGGLYIVEDICTSYPSWIEKSKATGGSANKVDYAQGDISCLQFFKNMIDEINFYGLEPGLKRKWSKYQQSVDWICFRSNSVFLRKHH